MCSLPLSTDYELLWCLVVADAEKNKKRMSCILSIDTSTNVCSVAVSQDGACIFSKEDFDGPNHAVKLGVYVDEAMSFADSHAIPLDAVAVSCGPGSYTGLRIGVSMAKGICYGQNLKLISVPTLELMTVPVLLREEVEEGALLVRCSTHAAWRSTRLSTTVRCTRCVAFRRTSSMPTRTRNTSTADRSTSSATVPRSVWR